MYSTFTPLQYSCLENPTDGGAWWAAVHGVAKSRTQLSDFTFTFHFHASETEMATHSSVLAWRIPGMGEPGGLPSMGSNRVGHDWSDLAAAAARPFKTNTPKRCTFHYRGLECKSRKSRNTWSNRQIWPWSTELSRAKATRVLPREHTGHSKHPLPTTQEKTTHGHNQMVNTKIRLIIFFAAKDGDDLYSKQKQDRKLTVAQITNSLLPNSDWNWRK